MTSLNRRTKRAKRVTLEEGVREDGADHEAEEGAAAVASGVAGAEVEAASNSKPGGLRTSRTAACEAEDENGSGWISSARRYINNGQQHFWLQLQCPGRGRQGLVWA